MLTKKKSGRRGINMKRSLRSNRKVKNNEKVMGRLSDEFALSTTSTTKDSNNSTTSSSPIARGGVAVPFPWKLHDMLNYVHENELIDIVRWDDNGKSFTVYNVKAFVKDIMPRFFSQTKYASFQRQCNLYGFHRDRCITNGNASTYQHEYFIQHQPELVRNMVRCKIKGTGKKRNTTKATTATTTKSRRIRKRQVIQVQDDDDDDITADNMQQYNNINYEDVDHHQNQFHDNHDDDDDDDDITTTATLVQDYVDGNVTVPPLAPQDEHEEEEMGEEVYGHHYFPTTTTTSSSITSTFNTSTTNTNNTNNTSTTTFHDGDLLFFEGYPFHFLDTKSFISNYHQHENKTTTKEKLPPSTTTTTLFPSLKHYNYNENANDSSIHQYPQPSLYSMVSSVVNSSGNNKPMSWTEV